MHACLTLFAGFICVCSGVSVLVGYFGVCRYLFCLLICLLCFYYGCLIFFLLCLSFHKYDLVNRPKNKILRSLIHTEAPRHPERLRLEDRCFITLLTQLV